MEPFTHQELSILIPTYNYACVEFVNSLASQAAELAKRGLAYEIIVADDGSTRPDTQEANSSIARLAGCRYVVRSKNVGRAAVRNFLARQARYQWLLFLDCDMEVADERFLERYLCAELADVVDGGIAIASNPAQQGRNLRYTYEQAEAPNHTAERRALRPYKSFRTTNFLVSRATVLAHPFDERFLHYGYEDVLFGKRLKEAGVRIVHTDNPTLLVDLEPNDVFLAKTEEALRTLHTFRRELRGYSTLLTFVEGIHLRPVVWAIQLWHRLFGSLERRRLCGQHPSLRLFKLYKLGYYLTIRK